MRFFSVPLLAGLILSLATMGPFSAHAQQGAQGAPSEEEQIALAFQCYGITKVLARTKSQTLADVGMEKIAWKKFKPVRNFWMLVLETRTGKSPKAINQEVAPLVEQVTQGISLLPQLPLDQAESFRTQVEGMAELCRNIQKQSAPPPPRGPVLSKQEIAAAEMCVAGAKKEAATMRADLAKEGVLTQLTGKDILQRQIEGFEAEAKGFQTLLELQTPPRKPPYRNAEAKLALEDQLTDESIQLAMAIAKADRIEDEAAAAEERPRDPNIAADLRARYQSVLDQLQNLKQSREQGCNALRQKFSGGGQ